MLALAGVLITATPFLSPAKADQNGWLPATADAAWNYSDYNVQRLALASNSVGPISIGGAVLVAQPPANCFGDACQYMNVLLFKNGVQIQVEGVPMSALSADLYVKNGNRFIYAKPTTEGVYAVYQLDLGTGDLTTLLSNISIPDSSNVSVMEDNTGTFFFTADINFSNTQGGFTQRALYVWDPAMSAVRPAVGSASPQDRELDVLDVRNSVALVKMTFPTGESQLWLFDTATVDGYRGTMTAIPATWATGGTIQYARFMPKGEVEYFMYFVPYTYHPGDTEPVRGGQLLSWLLPVSQAVQTDGTNLAWITSDDELYLDNTTTVVDVGSAPNGIFDLSGNQLFYGSNVYKIDTGSTASVPFQVTTNYGVVLAGTDEAANIYLGTGANATRVGYGTLPAISDPQHVYWRGVDGNIYVAALTVAPNAAPVSAVRATGDTATYLIAADGVRHLIPDQAVFFSWFQNWNQVQTITPDALDQYTLGAPAMLAVGTVIIQQDGTRIYAVANDGTIRHITNAGTGYALFGEDWYSHIITVSDADLTAYPIGADITTASQGANLF